MTQKSLFHLLKQTESRNLIEKKFFFSIQKAKNLRFNQRIQTNWSKEKSKEAKNFLNFSLNTLSAHSTTFRMKIYCWYVEEGKNSKGIFFKQKFFFFCKIERESRREREKICQFKIGACLDGENVDTGFGNLFSISRFFFTFEPWH